MSATFDQADLRIGKPDRPSDRLLAQIPGEPPIASLAKEVVAQPFASPPASVSWSLFGRHDQMVAGAS